MQYIVDTANLDSIKHEKYRPMFHVKHWTIIENSRAIILASHQHFGGAIRQTINPLWS